VLTNRQEVASELPASAPARLALISRLGHRPRESRGNIFERQGVPCLSARPRRGRRGTYQAFWSTTPGI